MPHMLWERYGYKTKYTTSLGCRVSFECERWRWNRTWPLTVIMSRSSVVGLHKPQLGSTCCVLKHFILSVPLSTQVYNVTKAKRAL